MNQPLIYLRRIIPGVGYVVKNHGDRLFRKDRSKALKRLAQRTKKQVVGKRRKVP